MNKFLIIGIIMLGFSFATNNVEEDMYYAEIDQEGEMVIAAYHNKEKDKSPLRKRYHKRKRRVRYPTQGK